MSVLRIENLRVEIPTAHGVSVPVDDVSFSIEPGTMLGLVGESGSGKSMTAMSILRMLPTRQARIAGGHIWLGEEDLTTASEKHLRAIRGSQVGTIFQEPLTALNPTFSIGDQLTEPLRTHLGMNRRQARARGAELLASVGIHEPERTMRDYPFQLSGGMRQRVMIAMAMSCEPSLLIADEPTTALDVTTQAQILDLMMNLCEEHGTAILLITHDLGVVAQSCEQVAVMHDGRLVEKATVQDLFDHPQADYTRHLLSFRPAPMPTFEEAAEGSGAENETPAQSLTGLKVSEAPASTDAEAGENDVVLQVRDLTKHYVRGRGRHAQVVKAVDGVSFDVHAGQTLAVVGESGSGKSTTGRSVLRLIEPTSGQVTFQGTDVTALSASQLRSWRAQAQIIFQDTYASLDPRWRIGASLAEPLARHTALTAAERRDRVAESLELVGLRADHMNRYPHEFSGGQRQRIGIARALVMKPSLVVADEPVSALDVSVQAQVLELMAHLQEEMGLAYLFITHDLSVVAEIADDVLVMNRGRVVESGSVEQLLRHPSHPYTRALLAAVPPSDPRSAWSRERQREIIARGLEAGAA